MQNKKTYLVLGSSGQIGSALVKYLEKKNHEVILYDIENDPVQDLRNDINPGLATAMNQADFVFFVACDVGGSTYLSKYQHTFDFIHNNAKLTSNTFNMLKLLNKPFIFASSQMSTMTHSPYGSAKALGENYTKALDGLVVKFWNVYGPETDEEKFHVIPDLIVKARDFGGHITLMTDGSEQRQFLYVDDCCECLYRLSEEYEGVDRAKNLHVTSFDWVTIADVARMIGRKSSEKGPEYCLLPGKTKDNVQLGIKNEPDPYIVKYWRPKVSLEEGIQKMVEFYVDGPGKELKKWP